MKTLVQEDVQSENVSFFTAGSPAVSDGQGIPLGKQLYSGSPDEVRLAKETLASVCVSRRHHSGRPRQKVRRVIADRAFDGDPLRAQLAARASN